MFLILMLVTLLAGAVLLVILVFNLVQIIATLNAIGGTSTSFLAKLRWGLRAIETETGHLPVEVTKLNEALTKTAEGLKVVDDHLVGTIDAVLKQKK